LSKDHEFKTAKATDGFISRYLNRKISWRITNFIINRNIPLTPNQVSIISFLISIFSLPFYILNHPVIAGLIVQISSIIDGVDGELARATGRVSKFGGFFDAFLDRIADIVVIIGAYIYMVNFECIDQHFSSIITFLALSGSLLVSYIHARGEASLSIHPSKIGRVKGIATRDIRLFLIFIFSLIRMVWLSLIIISILSYIYVVIKIIEVYLSRNIIE